MSSRAKLFAIIISGLICLPSAALAEGCADQVTASIGDADAIDGATGLIGAGTSVNFARSMLQYTIAQAVLAKQDADNIDTIDAFVPAEAVKQHAVLKQMHEAKEAQIKDLMAQAERITAKMDQLIALICAKAAAEQARAHADELARGFEDKPHDQSDTDTGPPPGGWGDPPSHDGSDSGANGDAAAAVVGGILLGGALANGGGGGGHHHGGGSGGAGCHPHN